MVLSVVWVVASSSRLVRYSSWAATGRKHREVGQIQMQRNVKPGRWQSDRAATTVSIATIKAVKYREI